MIKNVVFDVGNVLAGYAPLSFLETFIPDRDVREEVDAVYFRAPEWPLTDLGTVSHQELVDLAVSRAPRHEDAIRRAGEGWVRHLPMIDGMEPLVRRLKEKGYGLYIISNFSSRFHVLKELPGYRELFALMDGIVVSSDVRMVKPNRDIFDHFLALYALEASECLFIDDLTENIAGAREAGLEGHVFTGAAELTAYLEKEKLL